MKSLLLAALLILSACSAGGGADPLPPNIQLGADVILSASTATAAQAQAQAAQANAQAAQARSQAIAAQGTAVRQVTLDAMNARSTDAAIKLAFANVTQTTEARRATEAAAENSRSATEIANAHVEATRGLETSIARGETRTAVQTATRRADLLAAQTLQAAHPTQTRIAEMANTERADRERAQEVAAAQAAWDERTAPLASSAFYLIPPLAVISFFIVLFYGLWRVLRAGENLLQSRALALQSSAVKNLIILDRNGNPIGWIVPAAGASPIQFKTFDQPKNIVEPAASQTVTPPQQIAPPPEPLIGGVFYRSTLLAFLEKIRESGDWTQDTWANQPLPRGYVMSMDTVDEHGETVYGGYSKMLTYFVTHNLIVGRSRGSSGKWNPNAPTEIGDIMAILENNAPLPALPPVPGRASKVTPSPARSRVREVVPSV